MRIKIRGGTASNSEPSLCLTCRFATVVKGASLRDEIVECSQLSDCARVTFHVQAMRTGASRRSAKWKKRPGFCAPIPGATRSDSCAPAR